VSNIVRHSRRVPFSAYTEIIVPTEFMPKLCHLWPVTVILTEADWSRLHFRAFTRVCTVVARCTFSVCDVELLRAIPASSALRNPLFGPFCRERERSVRECRRKQKKVNENGNEKKERKKNKKDRKKNWENANKRNDMKYTRKETHDTPRPRQPRRARANRRQPLNDIPLSLYHIVWAAW